MPDDPFERLLTDYAAEDAFARSPRGEEVQPTRRFIACANGTRISTCYHDPRCGDVAGRGFGRLEEIER